MDSFLTFLFAVGAIYVFWHLRNIFANTLDNELGITGELIWVDKGKRTKPFFNQEYRVLGKPDLIYQTKSGLIAVEYKSRNANIYDSDIVQGLTASLAARGNGYNIKSLLVKTDNTEKCINLPKSDEQLFKLVHEQIHLVRKAKAGASLPSNPAYYKCLHCAFSESCLKK